MRDDEVAVGDVEVERGEVMMTPVSPPKVKVTRNPVAKIIGVSKVMEPRHIVPIQLKIFTPVGTAMSMVMREKNGNSTEPVTYMW